MIFARTYILLTATLLLALCMNMRLHGQCGPNVPSFNVDLSGSPSAIWSSPSVQRQDNCCGTIAPDNCVQFNVTLHPNAQGILFDICGGAVPGGAMFYQVGCGPAASVGQPLCLNGPGPHHITFCKPGNNTNVYCITSVPAPSAGPDIGVNDGCVGSISSTGFALGSVQWTSVSPGAQGQYDNYLNCLTCPNTAVNAQPGYPAFVDYQVCGSAISPCNGVQYCDTVRVYFFSTLDGSIAPQQPVICYGMTGIDVTVTGNGGTAPYSYLWNTGETSATIHVTSAGTYNVQVSDTSGCPPAMTQVMVTEFTQLITADAGNDVVLCSGSTSVFLNGAVTGVTTGIWSNGSGQYSTSNSDLNATYTLSPAELQAGSALLILSTTNNMGCPPDADTMRIDLPNSFAGATITGTDATCNAASDGSATFSPNDPGFTYLWNDPSSQTTAAATGLSAGTYNVMVQDGNGCDTIATITIGAPAALTIANLQVVDEGCAGTGDGSVTATITGGTPPYNYSWSNTATTPSIIVGAGIYTLNVTDANNCAAAQGSATVIAQAQPAEANAGADMVSCMNDPPIPLQGSVTNASGGTWSGGTGQFIGSWPNVSYDPGATDIVNGGVDLFLTTAGSAPCASDQDTVHIALSNAFLNSAVNSTPVLCNGQQSATAQFSPASPDLTYQWNDPASQTTALATGFGAGNYQVTVTDGLGCDTIYQVLITEPAALQLTLQATQPTCSGTNDGSAASTVIGGTPGYTYQWSSNAGGQNSPTAVALGQGTYILTTTDANGCTIQGTVGIVEPPAISLTALVPDTVCVNEPVTLTAQAMGGTGNLSINWQNIGSGSPLLYSFSSSQNVAVTVVDDNGCQGPVLTFPVYVMNLSNFSLATYGDTTVCMGYTATVSADVPGYPGSLTYSWPTIGLTGPGPFQLAVVNDQNIPVGVIDQCGQQLNSSIQLNVDEAPAITLPAIIAEGCAPLTVYLPSNLATVPLSYLWDLGDGNTSTDMAPTYTYNDPGQYSVHLTVTTPLGCISTTIFPGQVIVHGSPMAEFTANPWSTDMNDPLIAFTDASTGNITSYDWSFGDGATSNSQHPSHSYIGPGTFPVQLYVVDANGCTSSVTHEVQIAPIYAIIIPNVFTPENNGNGGHYDPNDLSNDVFYPFADYVEDFRMQIFNRWGELIFESEDIAHGWDGHYRGELSQQDVYVYKVWLKFVDGIEIEKRGDITLLR